MTLILMKLELAIYSILETTSDAKVGRRSSEPRSELSSTLRLIFPKMVWICPHTEWDYVQYDGMYTELF